MSAATLLHGPNAPSGAVVAVRDGDTVLTDAAGVTGDGREMAADLRFDIASVSKVVSTVSMLHLLVSDGALTFDDPVERFLSRSGCAAGTTVRMLLQHRAGLWEWQPFYLTDDPHRTLASLPLRYQPGVERHYSDLGFMHLGRIVETITGTALNAAFDDMIAAPLGLGATGYGPALDAVPSSRGDRAEQRMVETGVPYPIVVEPRPFDWRTDDVVGVPNDGNCHHAFGGVSGHAGLFATALDLLQLAAALSTRDDLFARAVTADVFADGPDVGQALGWRTEHVALRGASRRMVWHPGFTGCALGFIPGADLAVVMLTDRLLADVPRATDDLWTAALAAVPDLTRETP